MELTGQRYTADAWVHSPLNTTRSELVDGVPVERMTTGGQHAVVVKRLERWLDGAEAAGYGERFSGPAGVLLDPDGARANLREPDVCFFRRGRPIALTSSGIEGVPDLVIEVLSPGNRADDLPGGTIWDGYERFAVPAYWIVDIAAGTVTQYRYELGRFREIALQRPGDLLHSPFFPELTLPVADLFAGLA